MPSPVRIQTGKRFVKEKEFGFVYQRLREFDALPHPLAIGADRSVFRLQHVHSFQNL